LVLVGLAVPALAQEQGSVVMDAMTTPGRHFGMGYYITDRLSIRPSLGIGYSGQYGTTFNLGTDARFDLMPTNRFSPYLTAGFNYIRDPYLVTSDPSGVTTVTPGQTPGGPPSYAPGDTSNVTRFGGGAGFRARIKYGLSLVGEGRVMNSELFTTPGSPYQAVQNGAHFEAAVGISYAFN
jgi:hypothetical protein